MSYGAGGSRGSGQSASIVQACIAQDVGYERCLVLAHCKVAGFREGPWITQSLLREITSAHPGCKTSLAMGSTGCFLHIMEGKGAFVLCITEGRKNLPATYGFLDAVLNYYDGSPGMKGKFSDVTPSSPARSQDGGMKSIMMHWNDANVMKTEKLKASLQKTTQQLQGVINSLTVRAEKLDNLLNQSEDLAKSALAVQKAGQEVYCAMLKRYYKWIAMIAIGITVFILLIVAIVCGMDNC
eukprot:g931.t1